MKLNDIIARVSRARNIAELSARELSLRIGKNSAYISRLESKNDSFELSTSALLDIIENCNMTEEEFFYYDMEQYKKDKKLIDLLKKVKPEVKDLIIKLLESY